MGASTRRIPGLKRSSGTFRGKELKVWCPEGDLNPHGLAACGF
jgi:hypothetical protein